MVVSSVEDGVVVVLSGVEYGEFVPLGVEDGVVVPSVVDGVVLPSGLPPGMLLGVVVESVGLTPLGEIDPP